MIALYPHNERAYDAAMDMLEKKQRAAIIHPTGTGKSFIAFRYAQDHPQLRILWLSPSEYIFRTQLENIRKIDPQINLENLRFMTYAKLMLLTPGEIKQLAPQTIILDEFHRCGAEHWGEGVNRLVAASPEAKLLGLSATSVRYLDNQRDMAQELFDGNIASEMTLGEAIVRGILPSPKYVTTLFRYQQELEHYEKRIRTSHHAPARQNHEEKLLQALRRALEKSDGLDAVFARHMQQDGKYIVFCSSVEHMKDMLSCVPEWFAKVDTQPSIYTVYSENPQTSKEYADFIADESTRLRLLFCIDMLNEGVHISGISGVILFRPTISPIIYKQQIGRALTAGDSHTPLIIDVVNNMENLLSIGALQGEMFEAAQRLRENGEGAQIVTERFEIVDQVQDCRVLFEQLHTSLSSDWEQYFAQASVYAAEHGNLLVPKNHVTPGGLNLGQWIGIQRKVRAGLQAGKLTPEQIDRLDAIGMVWENRLEIAWERGFRYAQQYFIEHGNLLVPAKYETPDGYHLGAWIAQMRQRRLDGDGVLSKERIERLDAIGMKWDVFSFKWEENYLAAARYYMQHGDLMVPASYKTEDGFALGAWIRNLRKSYAGKDMKLRPLTQVQIDRLNGIGMIWDNCYDNQWIKAYEAAKRYFERHGNLLIPTAYISPDGIALGKWMRRQRDAQASAKGLDIQKQTMLNGIGMVWKTPNPSHG